MLRSFIPQEVGFFNLFQDISNLICDAAKEFNLLLNAPATQREAHVQRIKDLEHKADGVTHTTMTLLHKTFITPLDREDIHALIKSLDDIMDFMDAAAQRVVLYKIDVCTPEMLKFGEINLASVEGVRKAVGQLQNLKNSKDLLATCVDINRLENEADTNLRSGVAKLFTDESDIRLLIKLKEIYELLETVSDRCEDVANVVESIVIEYS